MKLTALKPAFWGVSVALSWTWGLGLFFAVQFTYQFGLTGLLSFAIPNALGLFLFGAGTHYIAGNNKGKSTLESYFEKWSSNYPSVFLFYQLIAITLTVFALARYLFQALDFSNPALLLLLVVIALLAAAILLGEQFNISRIKYSHTVLFLLLLICVGYLWFNKPTSSIVAQTNTGEAQQHLNFWGYLIPVCVGFFTGPWLDLQQWQRVIQMQKEKTSIIKSYLIGSVIFFLLLIFHGSLTLWAMNQGASGFARKGIDGIYYAQDMITRLLTSEGYQQLHWLAWSYFTFLTICIITTLDSGYLALRWFLQSNIKDKKNILFSMVPQRLLTTPIPYFILSGILALAALEANLELEYFMVFYATYFVGYAVVGIVKSLNNKAPIFTFFKTKMFAVSCLSLVIAGFGYIHLQPLLLIIGTLIPVVYGLVVAAKKSSETALIESNTTVSAPESVSHASIDQPTLTTKPEDTQGINNLASEYIQDKWYVYAFRATYGDTNSVGNVYFGMYAMWVGKTRELFFNHCLPDFNLKDTSFLILTRSFEHKFALEAREFDLIKVMIRVKSFNRKFATLEHRIFDQAGKLLGKGTQTVLFVSAATYEPLDIPTEVLTAFIPFTT
ncbi:MAG TPA: acyl-CoA thioesterase [Arachidicoccus sp.]|nr:acyl-CoA thioesterase [Arachidicoccus sp.]